MKSLYGISRKAEANRALFSHNPLIAPELTKLLDDVVDKPTMRPFTTAEFLSEGEMRECYTKKRRLTGNKFGPINLCATYYVADGVVRILHLYTE
jgi:hypothetical protein